VVELTDAGERLLQALDAHREATLAGVLAAMPNEAVVALQRGLAGFAAASDDAGQRLGLRPPRAGVRSPGVPPSPSATPTERPAADDACERQQVGYG
jgi:hypothetical protein